MSAVVFAAEQQIAAILSQLEVQTSSLIKSVKIVEIDETRMDSRRQLLVRSVVIELTPQPGTRWS